MARLPKNIIAKYGISKKAWQVFRSTRGSKKTQTKTTKRTGATMARKHKGKSKGSNMNDMIVMPVVGAAYGAIRQPVANMIPDFMGQYTDNAVLGLGSAAVAYFSKGAVRKSALTVLSIEAFIATTKATSGVSVSSQEDVSGYN